MSVSPGSSLDPQPSSLDSSSSPSNASSNDPEASLADDRSQAPQVLPVPMGPLRSQLTLPREEQPRPSFWRRIKMRTRGADLTGTGNTEGLAARMSAIEQQIQQLDSDLHAQLETLGERFEEVWQSEEQLSHLTDIQEKLDRLARHQSELSGSLAGVKRILGWLAALVVVAAAGAEVAMKYFL